MNNILNSDNQIMPISILNKHINNIDCRFDFKYKLRKSRFISYIKNDKLLKYKNNLEHDFFNNFDYDFSEYSSNDKSLINEYKFVEIKEQYTLDEFKYGISYNYNLMKEIFIKPLNTIYKGLNYINISFKNNDNWNKSILLYELGYNNGDILKIMLNLISTLFNKVVVLFENKESDNSEDNNLINNTLTIYFKIMFLIFEIFTNITLILEIHNNNSNYVNLISNIISTSAMTIYNNILEFNDSLEIKSISIRQFNKFIIELKDYTLCILNNLLLDDNLYIHLKILNCKDDDYNIMHNVLELFSKNAQINLHYSCLKFIMFSFSKTLSISNTNNNILKDSLNIGDNIKDRFCVAIYNKEQKSNLLNYNSINAKYFLNFDIKDIKYIIFICYILSSNTTIKNNYPELISLSINTINRLIDNSNFTHFNPEFNNQLEKYNSDAQIILIEIIKSNFISNLSHYSFKMDKETRINFLNTILLLSDVNNIKYRNYLFTFDIVKFMHNLISSDTIKLFFCHELKLVIKLITNTCLNITTNDDKLKIENFNEIEENIEEENITDYTHYDEYNSKYQYMNNEINMSYDKFVEYLINYCDLFNLIEDLNKTINQINKNDNSFIELKVNLLKSINNLVKVKSLSVCLFKCNIYKLLLDNHYLIIKNLKHSSCINNITISEEILIIIFDSFNFLINYNQDDCFKEFNQQIIDIYFTIKEHYFYSSCKSIYSEYLIIKVLDILKLIESIPDIRLNDSFA